MIGKNISVRRHYGFWWWKRSVTITGKVLDKVTNAEGKDYYLVGLPSGEVVRFDPLQTNFTVS